MIKRALVVLFGLFALGCAPTERYTKVTADVLPKAAMIRVQAVVETLTLKIDDGAFSVEKSTVSIVFLGAGVFVSPNGHILTCAHLFNEGIISSVTIMGYDGEYQAAEIIYQDARRDLALLKTDDTRAFPQYAKLADPRSLEVGQEVIAVGNPLGFDFSVSHGIISAMNRDEVGIYNATQSDAFVNPGNSGGPLFNLQGELIGINSRIVPPVDQPIFTGLGFSVSPGQILEFLTKFRLIDASLTK